MDCFVDSSSKDAVPITLVSEKEWESWVGGQPEILQAWTATNQFKAAEGTWCLIPSEAGTPDRIILGRKESGGAGLSPFALGRLSSALPTGTYFIDTEISPHDAAQSALGWALGTYRFETYRSKEATNERPCLVWPEQCDRRYVEAAASATFLVRDLVNTPANDMGPQELADAAGALAGQFGAELKVITGEGLLENNFPAIHVVGEGSEREPRLIDLRWGAEDAPKVTLVGKGVCFDTGGYNLKPGQHMALMKKDMGGAAHVLGLAQMILENALPVRLRVLIPAVENSVSGRAFRPSDVIKTRKGLSVEIGNTDAEGRLVLADALTLAGEENADLLVDFATLTGAARAALGPDIPPVFTDSDGIAADLARHSGAEDDPVWRLPLWPSYEKKLDSPIADLNNDGGAFAGAIMAALFLKKFVADPENWVHLDVYAWNPESGPGRPKGGEAMGMRAVYRLIEERYA